MTTKDELKCRISMALKDPILQQGFEIICRENDKFDKENAELKVQIEKMKCCMNCKYFDRNEPKYCNKGVFNSYVCNKWELAND